MSDHPRDLLVHLNGRFVASGSATVSVFDRGFRSGEGVFETLRSYRGFVFRLGPHLDRAYEGTAVLGFDPGPRGSIARAVTETASRNLEPLGGRDSAVRLTLTPGRIAPGSPFPGEADGPPTVVVTCHPLAIDPAIYQQGVAVAVVPQVRELPQVKALSYLAASLARAQARRAGAAEALLTDGHGRVLEGAASNVFAVQSDELVTPPVRQGLLPGVTRAVVLELADTLGLAVREEPLPLDRLATVDELFLTATTREVVPVVRVDGSTVGDGHPGPVTRALLRAYRAQVERERTTG